MSTDPEDTEMESRDLDQAHGGLHRLAPIVFAGVGVTVGVVVTLLARPMLGIPIGLLAGGVGVWMLERGRRLLL